MLQTAWLLLITWPLAAVALFSCVKGKRASKRSRPSSKRQRRRSTGRKSSKGPAAAATDAKAAVAAKAGGQRDAAPTPVVLKAPATAKSHKATATAVVRTRTRSDSRTQSHRDKAAAAAGRNAHCTGDTGEQQVAKVMLRQRKASYEPHYISKESSNVPELIQAAAGPASDNVSLDRPTVGAHWDRAASDSGTVSQRKKRALARHKQ